MLVYYRLSGLHLFRCNTANSASSQRFGCRSSSECSSEMYCRHISNSCIEHSVDWLRISCSSAGLVLCPAFPKLENLPAVMLSFSCFSSGKFQTSSTNFILLFLPEGLWNLLLTASNCLFFKSLLSSQRLGTFLVTQVFFPALGRVSFFHTDIRTPTNPQTHQTTKVRTLVRVFTSYISASTHLYLNSRTQNRISPPSVCLSLSPPPLSLSLARSLASTFSLISLYAFRFTRIDVILST